MCQHRKSELLCFPSVINSGVNLPQGSSDVGLCNYCTGSLPGPWVPVLTNWDRKFLLLILLQRGLLRKQFLTWAIFTSHGAWPFSSKICYLCLSGAGVEVHYLGMFVQVWKPRWKLFYVGNLSVILFFGILEIIQSVEGEGPRRRLL